MNARLHTVIRTLAWAGALSLALAGCQQAVDQPVGQNTPAAVGALSVKVIVPSYSRHELSKDPARIVAPGTTQAQVFLDGTALGTVFLDSTTDHPSDDIATVGYASLFAPPGTYTTVEVFLLDGVGTTLSYGSVTTELTVAADATASVEVTTFPLSFLQLSLGSTQYDLSVPMDGMQYYTFPAVADQTYYVTATPSLGAPDLFVFSSDGLPAYGILYQDLDTQIGDYVYYAGGPMTLRIDADMTGTYWAGLFGYGEPSDYELVVNLEPDDYETDDVVGQATPIAVGSAFLQVHNLHASDPADWLSFPATGGVTYVLETSNVGQSLDTVLYLYDATGETLKGSDDDSGTDLFSRLVWTCDITGTYTIQVVPYSSSHVGVYGVSVVTQ